ncbi:hypothetical protein [Aureimonas sp. ME7]|uniref:hypothetical protein n=1 Tax=Aureimonas sp. ME7 TaxID=2744252 RepID=UPI0015FD4BBC|nr:hypothetical protein [Aureimonas sp. ME7]
MRTPQERIADAMARGAIDCGELGDGWLLFPLFVNDDRFSAELPVLVRAAYDAAT